MICNKSELHARSPTRRNAAKRNFSSALTKEKEIARSSKPTLSNIHHPVVGELLQLHQQGKLHSSRNPQSNLFFVYWSGRLWKNKDKTLKEQKWTSCEIFRVLWRSNGLFEFWGGKLNKKRETFRPLWEKLLFQNSSNIVYFQLRFCSIKEIEKSDNFDKLYLSVEIYS